jgi:Flp pilus assembly protein TadD
MSTSEQPTPDESEGRLVFQIVYFFIGAFVAMNLWSAFQPTAWNWGFHFLAFYGIEVRLVVCALMLGIMPPPVQFFLVDLLRSFGEWEGSGPPILRWLLGLAVLALIIFLFVDFRASTYFLGNGYLQLRSLKIPENMDNINLTGFAREPLVGFFVFQLCRVFQFFESISPPEDAYLWLSVISGICFTVVAWKGIGLFVEEETDKILIFFLFFASGVSVLFFGYVENHAPGYVGILLFLLLGAGYLKEKISVYWAVTAYGLLLSMNFAAIAFIPAFAYLVYVAFRRGAAGEIFGALFLSGFIFVAALAVSGDSISFLQQTIRDAGANILPFGGSIGTQQAYAFFTLSHAADVANLLFLCVPAGVVLLVAAIAAVLKKRHRLETSEWFLLLAAVCGVALIVVLNCTLGMSRGWDIPAPFSVGILAAAIALLSSAIDNRETRHRMLFILSVVAMLHTGTWIVLNADARRSVARFETLEDKKLWGVQACLDAYEELAVYHRDHREFVQAAACYEKYAALDSTNGRIWLNCAKMELALGNIGKVIDAYKQLVRLQPTNADFYSSLGVFLAQTGRFDEALDNLQQAEQLSPSSAKIKNDIGAIYANQKEFSKALPYFLESVKLDPNFQGGYLNTAACYAALGNNEKAQEYRTKAGKRQ